MNAARSSSQPAYGRAPISSPPAPVRVLSIAGSDSSGGAGIQADIKTITRLGGYAMSAITAVTAQSTTKVDAIVTLDAAMVEAQIDACLDDIGADAIKIGMLGSAAIAAMLTEKLAGFDGPVVLDPVMVSTSRDALADADVVAALDALMGRASLITPNRDELAMLAGHTPENDEEAREAACTLADRHQAYVLAKGGHAPNADGVIDILAAPGGVAISFAHPLQQTIHTHGTGCTLSAAIAVFLAEGLHTERAVRIGIEVVQAALRAAPGYGKGAGPIGHHAMTREV